MKAISAVLFTAAMLAATSAAAHDFKVGSLDIGHPWSRPTAKGATVAGGYLSVTNNGTTSDRLIGGSSPAAARIELHEVANVDGVMKTRPLADGLEIKPGKTVVLKPGSYRMVLVGLKQPLQTGQAVKGTLVFEKAGTVEIVYNVEASPAAAKVPDAPKGVSAGNAASPGGSGNGSPSPSASRSGSHHHH